VKIPFDGLRGEMLQAMDDCGCNALAGYVGLLII